MTNRRKAVIAGASIVVLGAGGVGIATATGGGDSEQPISGSALDQAEAAALEHTGGGTVTDTEMGDEESYYEVEVSQDGGATDVQLNRDFEVVGSETDGSEDESRDE